VFSLVNGVYEGEKRAVENHLGLKGRRRLAHFDADGGERCFDDGREDELRLWVEDGEEETSWAGR
jgi:hypothetical protein